jgi:hypothetical protein
MARAEDYNLAAMTPIRQAFSPWDGQRKHPSIAAMNYESTLR